MNLRTLGTIVTAVGVVVLFIGNYLSDRHGSAPYPDIIGIVILAAGITIRLAAQRRD